MPDKFRIDVDGRKYTVRKLYENERDFSLYIIPHDVGKRGFFMILNKQQEWEILNKTLVSLDILILESNFASKIKETFQSI